MECNPRSPKIQTIRLVLLFHRVSSAFYLTTPSPGVLIPASDCAIECLFGLPSACFPFYTTCTCRFQALQLIECLGDTMADVFESAGGSEVRLSIPVSRGQTLAEHFLLAGPGSPLSEFWIIFSLSKSRRWVSAEWPSCPRGTLQTCWLVTYTPEECLIHSPNSLISLDIFRRAKMSSIRWDSLCSLPFSRKLSAIFKQKTISFLTN